MIARHCLAFALVALLLGPAAPLVAAQTGALRARGAPTVAEVRRFVDSAEAVLAALNLERNQAEWVNNTYITEDTEAITARAEEKYSIAVRDLALRARRYARLRLPGETVRKLVLLRLALVAPPPPAPAEAAELTRVQASMESDYGKGTYCRGGSRVGPADAGGTQCLQINELSRIRARSRDPAELLDVWQGWHRVGAPMRQRFSRYVALSNAGARQLGFADAGAMWRSNYDMPPEAFAREVSRLWGQVRPLYLALHAYVRGRLVEKYGAAAERSDGLIPAHLLGNMWAQQWGNVYDLVAPGGAPSTYDIGKLLEARSVDPLEMVRLGERFFTSLGFAPLPKTFWERSLIVKPRDREVVCHASAWDIDDEEDLRIKLCTEVTGEDFATVHHELGHNFYQRAYKDQPYLFKEGAHDGFHEAIGDAVALSITPDYLKQLGLLAEVPTAAADTGLLLRQALDKVAFLPFGLLIDQWRWRVFAGEVAPANYNRAWWELRAKYQGVAPPLPRTEADFDPGAKFHVPGNVPYTRYFLAYILQFQFYRSLCREAGYTGPLHRCSFYGSRAAGAKLARMLEAGTSRPWPDILQEMTGTREMDGAALLEYFAPLKTWLDRQNEGRRVGWEVAAGAGGPVRPATGALRSNPVGAVRAGARAAATTRLR